MSATVEEIAAYYDTQCQRMLGDFVRGNRRLTAAIELVTKTLEGRSGRLLDIGCGIGTSCHYYAKSLPEMNVLGVDISPKNIEIAQKLFAEDRIRFAVSDMSVAPDFTPFDAIALIDVYEHIPRSKWSEFNILLAKCLAPNGILILTTPSALHQEYLALHKPEGLQIVDETVTLSDLVDLSQELDATITEYQMMSIDGTNAYVHVIFQRAPEYHVAVRSNPKPARFLDRAARRLKKSFADLKDAFISRTKAKRRRKLVNDRLGIDVR